MKILRLTLVWVAIVFGVSLAWAQWLPQKTSFFQDGWGEKAVAEIFRTHWSASYRLDARESARLSRHFLKLCHHFRMDPAFVLAVLQAESGFRPEVISPAGAVGLMQVMPGTAREILRRNWVPANYLVSSKQGQKSIRDLKDPYFNLSLGVAYLDFLKRKYAGQSLYYPLAAYNLGPARFDSLLERPGFRPQKTWEYYLRILSGMERWKRYGIDSGSRSLSTRSLRQSALKPKRNVPEFGGGNSGRSLQKESRV